MTRALDEDGQPLQWIQIPLTKGRSVLSSSSLLVVPASETRVTVDVSGPERALAPQVWLEVYALWVAGPAGGAGFRKAITPQVKTASILVDRAVPDVRVSLV